MKKIVSLAMAGIMLLGACPMVYAADVDYQTGTNVTVVGDGGEYFVTVPASLEPGQTGTVRAYGKWASDETVKVWTEDTVEVTHTETGAKTDVNVTFAGIESLGNDLEDMDVTASISIDKGDIRFGEWTGTIEYNVELVGEKEASLKWESYIKLSSYDAETGLVTLRINGDLANFDVSVTNNGSAVDVTIVDSKNFTFVASEIGEYNIELNNPDASSASDVLTIS